MEAKVFSTSQGLHSLESISPTFQYREAQHDQNIYQHPKPINQDILISLPVNFAGTNFI